MKIKMNDLLEMLLPQALAANSDAPVIYPDSPVMEAVLLLRGEDDVAMDARRSGLFVWFRY